VPRGGADPDRPRDRRGAHGRRPHRRRGRRAARRGRIAREGDRALASVGESNAVEPPQQVSSRSCRSRPRDGDSRRRRVQHLADVARAAEGVAAPLRDLTSRVGRPAHVSDPLALLPLALAAGRRSHRAAADRPRSPTPSSSSPPVSAAPAQSAIRPRASAEAARPILLPDRRLQYPDRACRE
jgi:hypothetical protein